MRDFGPVSVRQDTVCCQNPPLKASIVLFTKPISVHTEIYACEKGVEACEGCVGGIRDLNTDA